MLKRLNERFNRKIQLLKNTSFMSRKDFRMHLFETDQFVKWIRVCVCVDCGGIDTINVRRFECFQFQRQFISTFTEICTFSQMKIKADLNIMYMFLYFFRLFAWFFFVLFHMIVIISHFKPYLSTIFTTPAIISIYSSDFGSKKISNRA